MPAADDRYRAYLLVLARREAGRGAARLDPSGVVQQTLLEAHAAGDGFAGLESGPRLAWLRTALARNLADEYRKLRAARRDVGREVEASAADLDGWLAAVQSSPSQKADRNEQLLHLAAALEGLPEAQRAAVEAHYFAGQPVAEVAAAMGKTTTAVAGLLKRGLQNLRDVLRGEP